MRAFVFARRAAVAAVASLLGFTAPLPGAHAAADHPHVIAGFTYVTGDSLTKAGVTAPFSLVDIVARGDTLTFTNLDPAPLGQLVWHSVTSFDDTFDSGVLGLGESWTLDTSHLAPGTYRYFCENHGPGLMSGAFIVQ